MTGFHTWLYNHAHWLYKRLSGYCYEMNCECEVLEEEIGQLIKKLEREQTINELIKTRAYLQAKAE